MYLIYQLSIILLHLMVSNFCKIMENLIYTFDKPVKMAETKNISLIYHILISLLYYEPEHNQYRVGSCYIIQTPI